MEGWRQNLKNRGRNLPGNSNAMSRETDNVEQNQGLFDYGKDLKFSLPLYQFGLSFILNNPLYQAPHL